MDALQRSWRITSEVASAGVVVDALDEGALAFYLHHEFQALTDHSDKLFLAMATVLKAFKPMGPRSRQAGRIHCSQGTDVRQPATDGVASFAADAVRGQSSQKNGQKDKGNVCATHVCSSERRTWMYPRERTEMGPNGSSRATRARGPQGDQTLGKEEQKQAPQC